MMMPAQPLIRFARAEADVSTAHDLLVRRIGPCLVEDAASFHASATRETADWIPRLGLAFVHDRAAGVPALAAAQLGGLLPGAGLVSLPYTAVEHGYEGRGIYLALKRAMLAELRATAGARGLPPPAGSVSEETPGSDQYRRKVEGGFAVRLSVDYAQPAALGLPETPLALTYEPLGCPPPAFTPTELLRIVTAVYRGLYRIAEPETDPAFRRMAASLGAASSSNLGGGGAPHPQRVDQPRNEAEGGRRTGHRRRPESGAHR